MKVIYKEKKIKLPDFFIVGAPRAGTTLLSYLLGKHPQIYLPALKEPMFLALFEQGEVFIDNRTGKKAVFFVEKLDDYLQLFKPSREGQLIGEASTWYLYFYKETLANMAKLYGEQMKQLKILVLWRNPAERAWSHYWHKIREGYENLTFEEAIEPRIIQDRQRKNYFPTFDYLGFSKYSRATKAYLETLPLTKVILYEDFTRDIDQTLKDVFSFLNLEPVTIPDVKKIRMNTAGRSKSKLSALLGRLVYRPSTFKSPIKGLIPLKWRALWKAKLAAFLFQGEPLPENLRRKLNEIFADEIGHLGAILGRDLTGWLKGN